jgi:hypothetical protein
MEYVCHIFKSTESLITFVYGMKGLKLPLFELQTYPISSGTIGYTVYFYKDDRYTPNLIGINPPKELTEEQFRIINDKWNYCVENDLYDLEFEI